MLEKKSKYNTLCGKKSARITQEQCQRLIDGDYEWLMQTGKPLCEELFAKMQYELLRPRVVVDYTRRAFVYKPGNVRVTIDDEVRSGLSTTQMFEPFVTVPADIRHRLFSKSNTMRFARRLYAMRFNSITVARRHSRNMRLADLQIFNSNKE